jgi:hypothetical protein
MQWTPFRRFDRGRYLIILAIPGDRQDPANTVEKL